MGVFRSVLAAAVVLALAACGGGASNTAIPPKSGALPPPPVSLTVDGHPATFTEYQLPPGVTPADVTVGPDGAIWFSNFSDFFKSTVAAGQITGRGSIRLVPEVSVPAESGDATPRLFTSGSAGIGAANGKLWMLADDPGYKHQVYRIGISPSTATITDVTDDGYQCCAFTTQKFARSSNGNLWYLTCPDDCGAFSGVLTSLHGPTVHIGDAANTYIPNGIGFGADGSVYVTATYVGVGDNGFTYNEGFVLRFDSNAHLLAQFPLPVNSDPQGITLGPDGNFWIAERGAGTIVRMTPSGQATDFRLPDPNVKPFQIIAANDGALWFTEQAGNAIGRITTTGAITEYPIPTPGAAPFGLVSCPSACENAHGRIWFSEQGSGKIGKLEY